jgi:phosphatidate cytidylyltransferase
MSWDHQLTILIGAAVAVLLVSSVVGAVLKRRVKSAAAIATVQNLNQRITSWWVMAAIFTVSVGIGGKGSVVLFGLISFFALREFLTLTPTRRGDHRALALAFFVVTPLQYYLVGIEWYGLYIIFIPVYAFLAIPILNALAGDTERFLERTSEIQWGLMVCVYMISYAPALLELKLPGYEGQTAKLLAYLVIVDQASDVLQYIWGHLIGKRHIAPKLSPNKTWEGFVGGVASATLLGAGLYWVTPFNVGESAAMSLIICLMGFFGGLTMSAIKRDRGVKDFGTLIQGHGGIMDRIDSLCFAAPIFFHLTRYYWLIPRSFPFDIGK